MGDPPFLSGRRSPDGDPTAVVVARVGQHVLDWLLFVAGMAVLVAVDGLAMYLLPTGRWASVLVAGLIGVSVLAAAVGSFVINVWWPHRTGGQTPAMRWLDLRIVDRLDQPAGLGALTVRWVLLLVDTLASGLVGLVVMVVTDRHQRVGDLAAGTLVVRSRTR